MIRFDEVFDALLGIHGRQLWWPADDRFEIIVGALLVQRTTWRNVEHAIGELRRRKLLNAEALHSARISTIQSCIRRAGFFRTKAARLRGVAGFVAAQGGVEGLSQDPTPVLRRRLLGVDGVGPETADAILLYAFDRPVVVVDQYLRRLAQRLTAIEAPIPDDQLREWVTSQFPDDAYRLNELHALIIAHGKQSCRKVPLCGQCVIKNLCRTADVSSET